MAFQLTSPAFTDSAPIPAKYTCEGENISPPLAWAEAPPGTMAYALIVEDPDAPDPKAPKRIFVHWIVYNLAATVVALPENAKLPPDALGGRNDSGGLGYMGPCPPVGRHRYFFKLYALSSVLSGLDQPDKAALERAMQGKILAQTQLMGTYEAGHRRRAGPQRQHP